MIHWKMATCISRDTNSVLQKQEKVHSENNVPKRVKNLKSSGVVAPGRPVLNEIGSNIQVIQNGYQIGNTTTQKSNIAFLKPDPRLTTILNRTTTSMTVKVRPLSNTFKTALKFNENVSNISKAVPSPKAVLKPYKGTLSRNVLLWSKSKQEKVFSENNVPKEVKDEKSSGIITPRRPVLNEIGSNIHVIQNSYQIGNTTTQKSIIAFLKPDPRLASNLNRSTTSMITKVKPLSITSKTALKFNENILNISKAVPRSKAVLKPYKGNLTKNVLLRSKSSRLKEVQKKEQVWNLDPVDKSNEYDLFHVGVYAKQIFKYLMTLEDKYIIRPDYLADHKYITPSNRSVVVDWLVGIQNDCLLQESLFTAVGILDRYLQINNDVTLTTLQLVGATSLLLGCKHEEIYCPDIAEFVYLADNSFTIYEMKSCLIDVFRTIGFSLSRPFSLTFLRRFCKLFEAYPYQYSLAKYFLELALIDYNLAHVKPSEVAAAGFLLATVITYDPELDDEAVDVKTFLSFYWTNQMQNCTSFKTNDLISTVTALANLAFNAPEWKYKAAYKKYQTLKMGRFTSSSLPSSRALQFLAKTY